MRMFSNQSTFVIVKEEKKDIIYKLEVDNGTQRAINRFFNDAASELSAKQEIEFTGSYKPFKDEVLRISNFIMPDQIKAAIRNPIAVDSFKPNLETIQEIRAIFTGSCDTVDGREIFTAAFQRFRKEQYISVDKINLFFDKTTFKQSNNIGISIGNFVDCVVDGTKLLFDSFFFARQIFDLSGYYRTAAEKDVEEFLNVEILDFGTIKQDFYNRLNSWKCRKIAKINDSGVLTKHTAEEIKKVAKGHSDIDIKVENNKIVFPEDIQAQKILLSFLDEESWRGAFSKDTYISNSKRKI